MWPARRVGCSAPRSGRHRSWSGIVGCTVGAGSRGAVGAPLGGPAPHQHLRTGPHRALPRACSGGAIGAHRRPPVCHGVIAPAAAAQLRLAGSIPAASQPAEHQQLPSAPHRAVRPATGRRAGGGEGRPAVRDRVVGRSIGERGVLLGVAAPAPHQHPRPGPDRNVVPTRGRRTTRRHRPPAPASDRVERSVPEDTAAGGLFPTPHRHFPSGPHRAVPRPRGRSPGNCQRRPPVRASLPGRPVTTGGAGTRTAPSAEEHEARPGEDGGQQISWRRAGAEGGPAVVRGVVPRPIATQTHRSTGRRAAPEIHRSPVHAAAWSERGEGAPELLIARQCPAADPGRALQAVRPRRVAQASQLTRAGDRRSCSPGR